MIDVVFDDLAYRDDRLVRQREQFQIGRAAAHKYAFEAMNLDQARGQQIERIGADQRFRAVQQFAETGAH